MRLQHISARLKTKRTKPFLIALGVLTVLCLSFSEWAYHKVENDTEALLYTSTEKIPYRKTGLLLGTSPLLESGEDNPFFVYRIRAAAELYRAGKIKYILASGQNSSAEYDEPTAMREALVKMGVPDSAIYLDYAGFRTIDSVIRAKEIFGRDEVTIISQPFHNTRALYMAKHYGLNAIAYNAQDVGGTWAVRQRIRERAARVKLFAELYLMHYSPHFLGAKEHMP